jgi:penicillin-binding protein A
LQKLDSNKRIIHLIIVISLLFLSIIGYLTYFQIFRSSAIVQNPYNKRQWAREDNTLRGTIFDRNAVILAETHIEEGVPVRKYPHQNIYSHIIGYSYKQYGRAGLEAYYNDELMALTKESPVARLREQISGEMVKGNNLVLTIDHEIQKAAEKHMKGKTGAAAVLNPMTGEILALVSKPDFNPNTLIADWPNLVNNEESPLLNRSISGMYPPGSTYKTVITAAVLENLDIVDPNYEDRGSITIDGYTLSNYDKKAHGLLDLKKSLVLSSNVNYARMSVGLGREIITEISTRFFMDKSVGGDLPIKQSRFSYGNSMGPTDLAAVGIGQGKLLVTPIHMALVASVFANEGLMVTPGIVREVQNPQGRVLQRMSINETRVVSSEIANEVKNMMTAVVDQGTGKNARISGIKVAGKTGTAENPSGESHAWFIGFAPADHPRMAVAVILEKEGRTGGAAAAPIARAIIQDALKRGMLN